MIARREKDRKSLPSLPSLPFTPNIVTYRYHRYHRYHRYEQGGNMAEIQLEEIRQFLLPLEGQKITLNELRAEFNILQGTKSYNSIRVICHRLAEQKVLKPLGARGEFRVLRKIEPVNWWDDKGNVEPVEFEFPRCHKDGTEFGIEDCVEVFAGDMLVIAGASNYGKTTMALNIMGENLGLFPTLLMGSEYTASDGKISPKFKRRM